MYKVIINHINSKVAIVGSLKQCKDYIKENNQFTNNIYTIKKVQ